MTCPDERGAAAPFVLSENIVIDPRGVQHTSRVLSDLLLPIARGAAREVEYLGVSGALRSLRDPCIPALVRLIVRVVLGNDPSPQGFVPVERAGPVRDEPFLDLLPTIVELDVGVTYVLAISTCSAVVHALDELGRDLRPASHEPVERPRVRVSLEMIASELGGVPSG